MTTKEMIEEIIEGLKIPNKKEFVSKRVKNKKRIIEMTYDYYLKSNKTIEDKLYCIKLLCTY